LADHPAAYVAAAIQPGRVHLALRGRGSYVAELPPDGAVDRRLDPALVAAAAHAAAFQLGRVLGPELVVNGVTVRIAAVS
jgi:hypothetical protein